MQKAKIRLTGLSPLLMHSTAGMSTEKKPGLKSKGDNLTGRDEAEVGAYRDSKENLVFPMIGIMGSLYAAASARKVGKITARRALAGVIAQDEFMTLLDENNEFIKDFDVDTRFVRIGSARVPRSRARIDEWRGEFEVEFDDENIDELAILELITIAGKMVGIGDYRPSTGGGPFGRFSAEII